VHVIPQKSYVCDSYITHKNPYMPDRRWGDASPHPPPGSATVWGYYPRKFFGLPYVIWCILRQSGNSMAIV